jgi:hypothetical protein
MPMFDLLIALFIMAAAFCFNKSRLLVVIAVPIIVCAPLALYLVSGMDGLVFSAAGMAGAIILTMPLVFLRLITWPELAISMALGSTLGAVPYAIAYCIAVAFLVLQKLLNVESADAPGAPVSAAPGFGSDLLALDERSALVEIEALKMLHRDMNEITEAELMESWAAERREARGFARARFMPWCAKMALATLTVLMLAPSM